MTTPLKPRYFLFAMLLSTTVAAVDSAMPAGSGSPAAAGNDTTISIPLIQRRSAI